MTRKARSARGRTGAARFSVIEAWAVEDPAIDRKWLLWARKRLAKEMTREFERYLVKALVEGTLRIAP